MTVTKDRLLLAIARNRAFRRFSCQSRSFQPFSICVECSFGSRMLAHGRLGIGFPGRISRLALFRGEHARGLVGRVIVHAKVTRRRTKSSSRFPRPVSDATGLRSEVRPQGRRCAAVPKSHIWLI